MIAGLFWRRSTTLVRAGLVLYAVAMSVALVYAAEHYVVDIVLGWIYAAVTGWAMWRWWPRVKRPGERVEG